MTLQIHEPGQEKDVQALDNSPSAVGIDLGTTNSLVAWVAQGVVQSFDTDDIIPSAVAYSADQTLVGSAAVALQGKNDITVVRSIKRLMGKTEDQEHHLAFPFAAHQEQQMMARLSTPQGIVTPVEVSAILLKHLKDRVEQYLKKPLTKAVITVPAYFDEASKLATKQAAVLAGWEVLRLLNEPTAAALAYGLDQQCEGLYMVYDLGGGTFDVSLLKLVQGVFQVVATKGNEKLGGDDIDRCLVEYLRQERRQQGMKEEWGFDDYQYVMQLAKELKEQISFMGQKKLSFTFKGQTSHHQLTIEQFNQLIFPYIQQTMEIFEEVFKEKSQDQALQGIILVGGSTRIPLIAKEIKQRFGMAPLTNIDPDRAVAWGAALQAAALTQGSETLLLDVVPLSLGIETMGGLVERIIPRNCPLPIQKTQQFTTFADFQQAIVLKIVQGEREMAEDCRTLGQFELKNIPPLPAAKARIDVTFAVDVDGLLTVTAAEQTTGQTQNIEVKPLYGLSMADMQRILLNSLEYRQADQQQRQIIQERLNKGFFHSQ